ncbi:MAG: HNH endonuclease [Firmicutes bacterium]|nr:HNH endonuclease [Bacillota bacterium]
MSREISEEVQRKLYAESMGRCMNPACQNELFRCTGDIIEKAHIVPYNKTADNSFENLVVLCPNCHTDFDKNSAFTPEEVLSWKHVRQQELISFFGKKYGSFYELKQEVEPLLLENKTIYEGYYLTDNKNLWDKFTPKILSNNRKLKTLLQNNLSLFQKHSEKQYSNLELVNNFMQHMDEFEQTRQDEEKTRGILFPTEINSIFGVEPVREPFLPRTESIEDLITKLEMQGKFNGITLGTEEPYIIFKDNTKSDKIFLNDVPRLRQLLYDYKCTKAFKVRFEGLNYILKSIRNQGIEYKFLKYNNLREIVMRGKKIIFIYEYCLSKAELTRLSPERNSVIVNLHNWNGEGCISAEARSYSRNVGVELLTTGDFHAYLNKIKSRK